jgi:hypothetical protein
MVSTTRIGRMVMAAAVAMLAAACDDDLLGSRIGEQDPRRLDSRRAENTGDTRAEQRIAVELGATGSFRPGTPIVVTSRARGLRAAAGVDYELVVLDEESTENTAVNERGRDVARFQGDLGRDAERQLTATVTFPHAGYYRIVATARSQPVPGETRADGDPAVIDLSSQTLYVLVQEQGGRLTDGFDPGIAAADPNRALRYGELGRFVPRYPEGGGTASLQTANQIGTARRLMYYSEEAPAGNRGIADALITFNCQSNTYPYGNISSGSTRTATDGSFSVACSTGRYNGRAELRNQYANVAGRDSAASGVGFSSADGSTVVTVPNRWAAHVFVVYNRYIPIAESRTARTRGLMNTYVSMDNTYDIHYHPGADRIHHNNTRIWNEDGRFVIMHEYGHAFHWRGLEPPASYWCSESGEHNWDMEYTFSCAWVEGFATFFSVWVVGDALTNSYYSDNTVETQKWALDPADQPFYTSGDGALIEGAVAAFLYDLADGSTSPDGITGDDDAVAYPGTFLVPLIANCILGDGSQNITSIDGVDLYVYCLEGDGSAANAALAVRPDSFWWQGITLVIKNTSPLPTGFSPTAVRTLWKRNLYGA